MGVGLPQYTVNDIILAIRSTLGSSNVNNLSNKQIIAKLNTVWQFFLSQDFTHFSLCSLWTFMTEAGIDRYIFPQGNALNLVSKPILNNRMLNLYDNNQTFFASKLSTLQNYEATTLQTPTQSININIGKKIARGYKDALGVAVPSVVISAVGTNGVQQNLYDFGTGELTDGSTGTGFVDYITGNVSITFGSVVVGNVYATYDNSTWTRPSSCLFYNNVLTLRAIPDQPYQVVCQVQYIPAPFSEATDVLPIPTIFHYLHYQTALLIATEINDESRIRFIQPLAEKAQAGIEKITYRQSDNRRRSNQFYSPEGATEVFAPYIINPYPPSITTAY